MKSLDEYHKDGAKRDGLRIWCKPCALTKRRRWTVENRERQSAYAREWYAANREHKTEYNRVWNVKNADRNRERYAANPERWREWRAAKPHLQWESDYRKRARSFDFKPVIESFTRDELIARWGTECFHCGGEWNSLDHYPQPVSRQGEHTLDNCRPSCMDCQQQSWREDFTPTRRKGVDR